MNSKVSVLLIAAVMALTLMSCESPEYTFVGDPSRTGVNVPAFGTATQVVDPPGAGDDLAAGDISFVLTWEITSDWEDDWIGWGGWSWNSGYVDMDIWVQEANGETLSSSMDNGTSGLGPTATGGTIDEDDDGHEFYYGSTFGPERAFWADNDAPVGEYTYGVRYFSGTVAALYTLQVFFGTEMVKEHKGQLVDPEADTSPEGPRITCGSVIYNG